MLVQDRPRDRFGEDTSCCRQSGT